MSASELYKSGFSITEVSNKTGIPKSTLRSNFLKKGILRDKKTAINLRISKSDYVHPQKGKKRVFTEKWKMNLKKSAIKRWEGKSLGYSLKPSGYIEITTGKNKGRRQHRVVMENFIGRKLQDNEVVHHKNGLRHDNRIENLQLMTCSEHSRLHAKERIEQGRNYDISIHSRKGEDHNKSKLTDSQVKEILTDMKNTKYYCKKFGLQKSAINKIKRRESWKHINIK